VAGRPAHRTPQEDKGSPKVQQVGKGGQKAFRTRDANVGNRGAGQGIPA
jgi:hypothetical protein